MGDHGQDLRNKFDLIVNVELKNYTNDKVVELFKNCILVYTKVGVTEACKNIGLCDKSRAGQI